MKYLLDINALVAWAHPDSPHHARFHDWTRQADRKDFWTCGHTELGFLRVSMQVFNFTLAQADEALAKLKKDMAGFVKAAPSPKLPSWAATGSKTSDAYLTQIARANGMKLATFDAGIKDPAVIHISMGTGFGPG